MRMFLKFLLIPIYLALAPSPGVCQTFDKLLKGVRSLQILTESLDQSSKRCHLSKDLIRQAVMYPFSSAKFDIVDKTDARLYVNIVTIEINNNTYCVSHIYLNLYISDEIHLGFSNRTAYAPINLWDNGTLIGSSRDDHAQHTSQAIESLAKKFVTD